MIATENMTVLDCIREMEERGYLSTASVATRYDREARGSVEHEAAAAWARRTLDEIRSRADASS